MSGKIYDPQPAQPPLKSLVVGQGCTTTILRLAGGPWHRTLF